MKTRSTAASALPDLSRQPFVLAMESTGAMFRMFDTVGRIQQRAAQAMLERHATMAGKLKSPMQPIDALLGHTQLIGEDIGAAMQCWQEISAAAAEMQTEITARCTELVDSGQAMQAAAAFGK
jgi:hypothetical protein